MTPTQHLVLACASLITLTLFICIYMLVHRVKTMKTLRITPQSVALSAQRISKFEDSRFSDNYNHLFELPIVFYVLCTLALVTQHIPTWFIMTAWLFVISRCVHSCIQCGTNNVMQRFSVFVFGILLLTIMLLGLVCSYLFQ